MKGLTEFDQVALKLGFVFIAISIQLYVEWRYGHEIDWAMSCLLKMGRIDQRRNA